MYVLAQRHKTEQAYRTVQLVVDYTEVKQLSGAVGKPVSQILNEFKLSGVSGVAVQEETLADLLDSGQAVLIPRQPIQTDEETIPPVETEIWVTSREVESRLLNQFNKLGYIQIESKPDDSSEAESRDNAPQPAQSVSTYGLYLHRASDRQSYVLTIDIASARNLPMGIDPRAIKDAQEAEMPIVARILNYPGVNTKAIDTIMAELKEIGVSTVIFGQEQVLGFRGLVKSTANAMKHSGLTYGSVEFAKQKGDAKLSQLLDANLIRVHSVPAAEMATLDKMTAIERYTRAARERNIRMCYLRLFDTASDNPVKVNAEYISRITVGLNSAGFKIGTAAPINTKTVPLYILPLLGVSVALGLVFLLTCVIRPAWYYTVMITMILCVAMAVAALGGVMAQKALALLAAIIFPVAAVIRAGSNTPAEPKTIGYWSSGARAFVRLVCATAITAAGGAIVAALLSERQFMIRVDQFAGVKLAHVAPMALGLLVFAGGIAWSSGSLSEQCQKLRDNLRKLASEPVLVWQTVAVLFVIVLLGVAVARSGNDSGVGVSAFELKMRALLDKILFVRPRTKEFLIGHPILFLGIAAAIAGRRKWAAPLIIFGAIGQISVLNTFCHIHTPIAMSLIRVASGLVTGSVIGLVLYAALRPVLVPKAASVSGTSSRNTKKKLETTQDTKAEPEPAAKAKTTAKNKRKTPSR